MKDTSRIFAGENFQGTAMIYAITPKDQTILECDFSVSSLAESWPEEMRACREIRRSKGQEVKPLGKDHLRHETLVIFGPEQNATAAVASLKRLIQEIEENGLLVGRDEVGDYVVEKAGRK